MPDADLERPERSTSRISAFGKHQHDATAREHLVHGPQSCLVELALMRGDGKHADEWQEAAFPPGVEHRLSLGHRVDHRSFRKERDYERRVEPGLVVGRDDEWRRWDVLEAGEGESKDLWYQPSDEPSDQAIEAGRMLRVRVDKRVERAIDKRPELGPGVGLGWFGFCVRR